VIFRHRYKEGTGEIFLNWMTEADEDNHRLLKKKFRFDVRKYTFSKLLYKNQNVKYDFTADLTGTGNRSEYEKMVQVRESEGPP